MIDEVRANGGCLRLTLTALSIAFVVWFLLTLVLLVVGQAVDDLLLP